MLTKRGIELDITQSNYRCNFKGLIFCFSSKFYLNKFEKEVQEYIDIENKKLYNKYKLDVDFSLYLAIAFYKKIEKRGFRIIEPRKKETIVKIKI